MIFMLSLMLLFTTAVCKTDKTGITAASKVVQDVNSTAAQVIEIKDVVDKLGADEHMQVTKTKHMKMTVREVHDKLHQLHKAIDHLQSRVRSMDPNNHESKSTTTSSARDRLGKVIADLSAQNLRLSSENRKLKTVNTQLVDKLHTIENKIKTLTSSHSSSSSSSSSTSNKPNAKNDNHIAQGKKIKSGLLAVESWVREAVEDMKAMLSENGIEHYLSPKFSPLVAGVVCNNMLMLPLAITLYILFRRVHILTFRCILALSNAFDTGVALALIINALLLLDDPLQGLRHISQLNFVFVQYVLSAAFWIHIIGLSVAVVKSADTPKVWKLYAAQIALKAAVGLRYHATVWVPVVDNDEDAAISPGFWSYLLFVVVCAVNIAVTARASAIDARAAQNKRCVYQPRFQGAIPTDSGCFDNVEYQRLVVQ